MSDCTKLYIVMRKSDSVVTMHPFTSKDAALEEAERKRRVTGWDFEVREIGDVVEPPEPLDYVVLFAHEHDGSYSLCPSPRYTLRDAMDLAARNRGAIVKRLVDA